MSTVYSADHGDNHFRPIGTLSRDGIKFKGHPKELYGWGGKTARVVKTLQETYSVSWDFRLDAIYPDALAVLFGPLFPVAYAFSQYTPFWYLKGDE